MKRYAILLFISALSLTSHIARADIVDDAIGNIQRAINDAYHPSDSRNDDDRQYDDDRRRSDEQSRRYEDRRRQLEDRRRQLDDRQRQLDQERRQLDDEERRLEDEF
ncbi:hypothetical protein PUATCC27989T_03956 [Phytobacter ursingii]|jgi:Skp family chaperone for outer membrane proteins|uniref:Uncharacterized protein YjdP n=2 Tax=Enterobacteriaceae TaxID=543 RepID=A0AAC8QS88_9ENTR|nr:MULTISPECIES: DDRRRQL repeat protein YjdP [Enterobacteriaceae]AUV03032.1 hypothetical protein C2U51_19695 [Enterobacteriaceae bacterium ENNIH1]MDU6685041.1 DDRRRQL repeat protein YjdP [Enterobacteriaceae bacterium]RDT54561.1 hypothetical protein DXF93_12045 [Escherichia coli]AKL14005.1 membrane protein [Phytobacter ursingii]MCL9674216.1 hypothetical protein [Citrobacter sp. MNAZ 1397]